MAKSKDFGMGTCLLQYFEQIYPRVDSLEIVSLELIPITNRNSDIKENRLKFVIIFSDLLRMRYDGE